GEERDHFRDLLGLSHPPERNLLEDRFLDLGGQRGGHRWVNEAPRHRIDEDPAVHELEGKWTSHLVETGLLHRIGHLTGVALVADGTPAVRDAPALLADT